MKTLKFEHDLAQMILKGQKTSTWRLFDDKDLSVDDTVKIVDKVKPDLPSSWKVVGQAKINEVIEKRLGQVRDEDMKGHEQFANRDEMLKKYKLYYGERVTFETPVKIINFSFTNLSDAPSAGAELLEEAKLFTDGGSRGNPGPSAIAFVICKMDNSVVEKSGEYIGETTNNQAEYQALKMGLKRAQELGVKDLIVNMDSELVVKQINGLYKMKNADLRPHFEDVKQLERQFDKITFNHVPRKLNAEADAEVNRILDSQ